MSSPFVGEIRLFAGNFAPAGWALCDGSLLPIVQNEVLFTLIGTTYGGDGVSTFALPDLRGRVPVHTGPTAVIGQLLGSEQVALTWAELPAHQHACFGSSNAADAARGPAGSQLGVASVPLYGAPSSSAVAMAAATVLPSGGNQPHDNMAPYLAINYIIAMSGIFPSRA